VPQGQEQSDFDMPGPPIPAFSGRLSQLLHQFGVALDEVLREVAAKPHDPELIGGTGPWHE
jgi:hypothetical protein